MPRKPSSSEPITPPTPERIARGEVEKRGKHVRVKYATQLEKLLGMGKITPEQFAAGDLLWVDWRMAGMDTTRSLDIARFMAGGGGSSSGDPAGERQAHHHRRFRAAMNHLNHTYRDIVLNVCILNTTLTEYTASQPAEWRAGYACLKLKDALSELASFYEKYLGRKLV